MLWESYLKKTRNGHYYISIGLRDATSLKPPFRIGYAKLGDRGKTATNLLKYNDNAECYDINYENSALFLNVNHSYPWSYKSAYHFYIIDLKKPIIFKLDSNSPIK